MVKQLNLNFIFFIKVKFNNYQFINLNKSHNKEINKTK